MEIPRWVIFAAAVWTSTSLGCTAAIAPDEGVVADDQAGERSFAYAWVDATEKAACAELLGTTKIEVTLEAEPSSEPFARAVEAKGGYQIVLEDGEFLFEDVSTPRYFLGRNTKSWLMARQCAHISLGSDVPRTKSSWRDSGDTEQEHKVDCLALDAVVRQIGGSRRTIAYGITRDLVRDIDGTPLDNQPPMTAYTAAFGPRPFDQRIRDLEKGCSE